MDVSADFLLSTNLNSVTRGMVPEHLNKKQRHVLQEILTTLQGQITTWDESDEDA